MDDYNMNVLSEAKNEYSSRLVSLLTPVIIEGIKSIFNEAQKLCIDNDENDKYLMTFQNFLTRVPKWNSTIIQEETTRIINATNCSYLEDLLTCVHITQLKILTSIRVSSKQKKIDIDIPKLNDFIHKVYIELARKLYSNVYLFETEILPLQHQKNMRECEIITQECILNTIRNSMPVENILRAYMDETVDEEIIEEVVEKTVLEKEPLVEGMENKIDEEKTETSNVEIVKTDKPVLVDTVEKSEEDWKPMAPKENDSTETKTVNKDTNINISLEVSDKKQVKANIEEESKKSVLSFNDEDSVLNMGTNKESIVQAPKTEERLEKISYENNKRRKEEEAMEDDDEEEKIKIFDSVDLQLDNLDINNIEKQKQIKPDPILNDIEILG